MLKYHCYWVMFVPQKKIAYDPEFKQEITAFGIFLLRYAAPGDGAKQNDYWQNHR